MGPKSMITKITSHRQFHEEDKEDAGGISGDVASNEKRNADACGPSSTAFGRVIQSTKPSFGDSTLTSTTNRLDGGQSLDFPHSPKEKKILLQSTGSDTITASGKTRSSSRMPSPWDGNDAQSEQTEDVMHKMLQSHWTEQQQRKSTDHLPKKSQCTRSHLPLTADAPTSTGLIHRSDEFDMDDNESETWLDDDQSIVEVSLASDDKEKPSKKSSRMFAPPDRSHSSDTMKNLFEKSLSVRPQNRSSNTSLDHRAKDEESNRQRRSSTGGLSSPPSESQNSGDNSFNFDDVIFPNTKTESANSDSKISSDQHSKKNSSGSMNFQNSPFTSPKSSSSSLRNFIGRGSGLAKQASFRSTDTPQSKSTISGEADMEAERQRTMPLEPPRNDSHSKLPPSVERRRINRGPGMIKSNSNPSIPMPPSPAYRRSSSAFGLDVPSVPPLCADSSATPIASVRGRKTLQNTPPNPLNPAPESIKWSTNDDGLNKLSNMLLARKLTRDTKAENSGGNASNTPTVQGRRSLAARMERHTSVSPSSRRGSLGNLSPRPGSRRKVIPEDITRSPGRRSQRERSKSPHSLAAAAAAAARSRQAARRPGCTSRRPAKNRTSSPRVAVDKDRHPQTPPAPSPHVLTAEQIMEQIRTGNFNLKVNNDFDCGRQESSSSGRITLAFQSAADSSESKCSHSMVSTNHVEGHRMPAKMPFFGNQSEGSALASPGKQDSDKSESAHGAGSTKQLAPQSPSIRISHVDSNSTADYEAEIQAAKSLLPREFSISPRRGRRKEILEKERQAESRSRSPSFHTRRRQSNRFSCSPQDLTHPDTESSTSHDKYFKSRSKRQLSSKDVSEEENRRGTTPRRSPSREVKSNHRRDTKQRTTSSRRERSRSRSKASRNRLRRHVSRDGADDQPEMPEDAFASSDRTSKRRPSPNVPSDAVESRRSSRILKEGSPSRSHKSSSRRNISNPRQSSFRKASPSTRHKGSTGEDPDNRPPVASSPNRSQRNRSPQIVVSPIYAVKGQAARRHSNGSRSQSDRSLFSSQWAHGVNDEEWLKGGTNNDENQRQPTARNNVPPPPPLPLPSHRRVKSGRGDYR